MNTLKKTLIGLTLLGATTAALAFSCPTNPNSAANSGVWQIVKHGQGSPFDNSNYSH